MCKQKSVAVNLAVARDLGAPSQWKLSDDQEGEVAWSAHHEQQTPFCPGVKIFNDPLSAEKAE